MVVVTSQGTSSDFRRFVEVQAGAGKIVEGVEPESCLAIYEAVLLAVVAGSRWLIWLVEAHIWSLDITLKHRVLHLIFPSFHAQAYEVRVHICLLRLAFIELHHTAVFVILQKVFWLLVEEDDLLENVDLAAVDLVVVRQKVHHEPVVAPLDVHVRLLLLEAIDIAARVLQLDVFEVVDPGAVAAEGVLELVRRPAYVLPAGEARSKCPLRHLVGCELRQFFLDRSGRTHRLALLIKLFLDEPQEQLLVLQLHVVPLELLPVLDLAKMVLADFAVAVEVVAELLAPFF